MDKREFLKVSSLITAGLATGLVACKQEKAPVDVPAATGSRSNPFELPALNFEVDALAPNIDKMTMEIHHGKHHAGYVRKLNKACEGTAFEKMELLDILSNVKAEDTGVRNNGGGHYNHSLFWDVLAPNGGGQPTGELGTAITSTFGDFDTFQAEFSKAAKTRFGSGWAWLSVDADKKLFISSTPNQDNPLMTNIAEQTGTPILGIDVWEHAYYLNYQNKRGDYIANFFNVVNWGAVAKRLAAIG